MKKTLLLYFGLLLLVSFRGQAAPATVNFASERGLPFQLVFDGRPLTRGSASQVRIDRLTPGFHWAEFRIPTAYGGAVNYRTRLFLDPGLETSFVLLARSGYPPALRKVAAVPIRYGGYPVGAGYPGRGVSPGYGGYPGSTDTRPNEVDPEEGYSGPANPVPGPNGPYSTYPAPNNGSYADGSNYRVMAPADVEALLQVVNNKSFDNSKLAIAKQALDETFIRADDLTRLLQTLDFENARLELAKYAYSRVADRQNFYRVYDAFTYESTGQELQRFVEQNRS